MLQLNLALRRQAIEPNLAIGFRDSPFRANPPLAKQLLQRGVQKSFFYRQDLTGEQMNPLCNGITVQCLRLKHAKNEHGKCPGGAERIGPIVHRHNINMPMGNRSTGDRGPRCLHPSGAKIDR